MPRRASSGVESATSRATYEPEQETFLQRQLREFHNPVNRTARAPAVAEWAKPAPPSGNWRPEFGAVDTK